LCRQTFIPALLKGRFSFRLLFFKFPSFHFSPMKKSLLTLGLLGMALGAFAQANPAGPWVAVNTTNVLTSANYLVDQIQTLSPTSAWALMSENATSSPSNTYARTTNATGTEFDFGAITGTTGFQAANIHAVTDLVAYAAQFGPSGGEVLRTTNGGVRWNKITNNTQFALPNGFTNWVYMFDADNGVAMGDPNPLPASGPGVFEIWRTSNGSAATPTWTRVSSSSIPAPLDADDYGLVRSYYALPGTNTIWFGTQHVIGTTNAPVRVFKSTDRGATWTAASTPLNGSISRIAFKDANVGIATTRDAALGVQLIRTTDGGATWTSVTPSGSGKFYGYDIDAVPGLGFFSSGSAVVSGPAATDFGVSFSPDGLRWVDEENAGRSYTAVDMISCGTNGYKGYLGGFTNATDGTGGFYQVPPSSCPIPRALPTRNAALQKSLSVTPNPSADGLFTVQLADGIKAGTVVTIVDAMGRLVMTRELSATAASSKSLHLDLSKEKAGVYVLKVVSTQGFATEKLVIQ
jgi:photosystem II stability/assembly factor-like uncharacterized protein